MRIVNKIKLKQKGHLGRRRDGVDAADWPAGERGGLAQRARPSRRFGLGGRLLRQHVLLLSNALLGRCRHFPLSLAGLGVVEKDLAGPSS